MNAKSIHKLLVTGLTILVLLVAFSLLNDSGTPVSANNVLGLQSPSFISVASAAGADTVSAASFLEDEAGIAAYTYISETIDLSIVRDEFRTIERETSQYIVGSVGIPDYTENFDPHVYVHTDGWVVAYYLVADPASMIIDLRHYDGVSISTMLENAMDQLLTVIGVVTFETNYYDFRYPNATNLMLIAEVIELPVYESGEDSFEVKLPSEFTYYERAWSHAVYANTSNTTSSALYINSTLIDSLSTSDDQWKFAYGTFTPAQLPPGVFHTTQVVLDVGGVYAGTWGKGISGSAFTYQEVP